VTGRVQNSELGVQNEIDFSTGSNVYAMEWPDLVNLSQFWNTAEFNIVGDCCFNQVNFNAGSSLVVRISVANGIPLAPSCDGQGFTGETNNLNFASPPTAHSQALPAVVFTESTAGGVASACQSATEFPARRTPHDFNNDKFSDILWRHSAGWVAIWLTNGSQALIGTTPVPLNWSIVGTGDFNGDGWPAMRVRAPPAWQPS
jgi:hypothetical protein